MQYVSTRGARALGQFSDVLLDGLAPDGGLAMPAEIPRIDAGELARWKNLSYADLAFAIMRPFIDDIAPDDLREILSRSYDKAKFGQEEITPLIRLGDSDLYLLELSNGPSLAFKDIAMQFLGEAFDYVLAKRGARINILGATSGDTGSAAEYAMIGKDKLNVFMLSPYGRMSEFQQAQMYSLDEANIFNIAVKGVFDDCQDLVKAVNADASFKAKYRIGAVNSINWGRVLAQTVYYFKAYFAFARPLDFCVPSGNFGNVFAGYLAKSMGLPIRKLVVASNENDVLHEFFTSGVYRVRTGEKVAKTSSPSMDIGKASNFERYLYLLSDRDSDRIARWWRQIGKGEALDLRQDKLWRAVVNSGFRAGRSTHRDRLQTIADIDRAFSRLIDPHTADGVCVGRREAENGVPMVCLETALPAKFAETVREALGREAPRPRSFVAIEEKPRYCDVLENDPELLKTYIADKLPEEMANEAIFLKEQRKSE